MRKIASFVALGAVSLLGLAVASPASAAQQSGAPATVVSKTFTSVGSTGTAAHQNTQKQMQKFAQKNKVKCEEVSFTSKRILTVTPPVPLYTGTLVANCG
ncbi:hypothetical protein OHV05_37250 (plasmid) [Kitasatospora sp. NBC_00070]|uniref:hypothetical protein n=1 Tax=Kitasatospora sp. NBC_00070 TaxID=2975962 RepID=UPI002F906F51